MDILRKGPPIQPLQEGAWTVEKKQSRVISLPHISHLRALRKQIGPLPQAGRGGEEGTARMLRPLWFRPVGPGRLAASSA